MLEVARCQLALGPPHVYHANGQEDRRGRRPPARRSRAGRTHFAVDDAALYPRRHRSQAARADPEIGPMSFLETLRSASKCHTVMSIPNGFEIRFAHDSEECRHSFHALVAKAIERASNQHYEIKPHRSAVDPKRPIRLCCD